MWGRLVVALCLLLGWAAPATSQAPLDASPVRVEVWTMGPGTAVWERFGHNALVLTDVRSGQGRLYNWGMFSFQQENFFLNFAKGRMNYWMAGQDPDATLRAYALAGRTVWRQQLRLTDAETRELLERLIRNDTDETRFYRYDYYHDNCSTRVRDAVNASIDGQLRQALDTVATGTTYRSHTRDLVRPDVPLYTGLQLLLGPQTDRPISAWEEAFLPMALMRHLDGATRRLPDGSVVGLLAAPREELVRGPLPTDVPPAASAVLPLGLVGLVLAALVGLAGRGSGAGVWPAVIWAVVSGVGALVLWAAWLFTDHAVAGQNANLLLLTGLSLPLAFMVRRPGQAGRVLAVAIAGGTALAALLAVVPGGQPLAESVALLAPANLALAWVVRVRARQYP